MYITAHYLQVLESIVSHSPPIYFIIINLIKLPELSVVLGQSVPLFHSCFLSLSLFPFFLTTNMPVWTFLLYNQTSKHRNVSWWSQSFLLKLATMGSDTRKFSVMHRTCTYYHRWSLWLGKMDTYFIPEKLCRNYGKTMTQINGKAWRFFFSKEGLSQTWANPSLVHWYTH